jgi:peptide/nickel transport system substrate-binding protein
MVGTAHPTKYMKLKQWRTLGQFLCLFCLCFFMVVSCNNHPSPAPTSTPSAGGSDRLSVGTTERPRTLDPADGYEVATSNIITSLGDRLYSYKKGTLELEPQLATELPKVSEDGLIYTIPLRKGVSFHDGTPFNGSAMAFSLKRFSENGGKPSALLSDIMESVKATGEYEITIKLKNAFAPFPSLLAYSGMCAVSPKAYEIGEEKFKPNDFVGTGPYKLTSFSPNLVKMDVFDQYWGEKPANQGIDFQILSSRANLYNAFTTGTVDVAYQSLDADQIISLQQKASSNGWQVVEKPGSSISYIVLNVKQIEQLEVRQAIAAMIDRPLITERVYKQQAEPIYSIVPTNFEAYKPTFQEPYGDGNVEKVKELLTQAGFSQDKPFELEIYYASNSSEREQTVSTLREYAAQKLDGIIQIKPQPVESTTLFANASKGLYQSYLVAWFPDFGDPDNYIQPFFSCAKGSVETGCEQGASQSQGFFYYSDRMNQLIQDERTEQNPEVRQKIFAKIQDLLAEDVPLVPLWQKKEYAFVQKPVQNVNLNPVLGPTFWNVSKGA